MQSVMLYIAYTIAALLMLIALAFMFTDIFYMSQLPSHLKILMGVVLYLYGIFKIVATHLTYIDKKEMSKATI